jgi:TIR domain
VVSFGARGVAALAHVDTFGAPESSKSKNVSSIRVFISYRRNDAPHAAGRIADRLMSRFGEQSVFRDVDAIEVGDDYKHRLLSAIPNCDVLLAVIGPAWTSLRDRLHDEKDVLRQELEYALALKIPVVPILIDQTPMPKEEDFPAPLRGLERLEAQRINDSTFRIDLDRLVDVLEKCRSKPVDIPVPGPGAPITGEHLALINSSWRAPKHDSRFPGNKVYRFDVILAGDPSVLGRIEKVIYMLPPAWGETSPIEVDSKTPLFGLKQLAWSDLLVRARIYVQQQFDPVYLSSFVRLTDHGTRLVPR